jgi:hypothetical protein
VATGCQAGDWSRVTPSGSSLIVVPFSNWGFPVRPRHLAPPHEHEIVATPYTMHPPCAWEYPPFPPCRHPGRCTEDHGRARYPLLTRSCRGPAYLRLYPPA